MRRLLQAIRLLLISRLELQTRINNQADIITDYQHMVAGMRVELEDLSNVQGKSETTKISSAPSI